MKYVLMSRGGSVVVVNIWSGMMSDKDLEDLVESDVKFKRANR